MRVTPSTVALFVAAVCVQRTAGQAQLCSKPAEFSACVGKAETAVAGCNQLAGQGDGQPNLNMYNCLCEKRAASLACYQICPDDPQMQLQLRTINERKDADCQAAQEMKDRGLTLLASSSTATATPSAAASDKPKNGTAAATTTADTSATSAPTTSGSATPKDATPTKTSASATPSKTTKQPTIVYNNDSPERMIAMTSLTLFLVALAFTYLL